jgi:dephospho-CoA kinase
MADSSPGGMKIAECISMADGKVNNNLDLETLHREIDKIIHPLLNKK